MKCINNQAGMFMCISMRVGNTAQLTAGMCLSQNHRATKPGQKRSPGCLSWHGNCTFLVQPSPEEEANLPFLEDAKLKIGGSPGRWLLSHPAMARASPAQCPRCSCSPGAAQPAWERRPGTRTLTEDTVSSLLTPLKPPPDFLPVSDVHQ